MISQHVQMGQSEWLDTWSRRKWKWAGKLASNDAHKWSATATLWQPLLHSTSWCGRAQARPKKRWEQDILEHLSHEEPGQIHNWYQKAKDSSTWMRHIDSYASFMGRQLAK